MKGGSVDRSLGVRKFILSSEVDSSFVEVGNRPVSAHHAKKWGYLVLFRSIFFGTVTACVFSFPALSETMRCVANLGGQPTFLDFDDQTVAYRTIREKWSPFAPSCPSDAIIAKLKPDLDPRYWKGYCLITDDDGAYTAAIAGVGDRFGRCPKKGKVCKVINSAKEFTIATAAEVVGTIVGTKASMAAVGASVVQHSSETWILTGTSGYIAGTLGTASTTAVGIVTAPATLAGVAAGAVVIGGAVLVCGS